MQNRLPSFTIPMMVGASLGLAGCAQPNAGPNTGAAAVQAAPDVALATSPTRGQELSAVAANRLEVSFSQGGTRVSASDARQLDTAARLYRDVHPVRMFVAGYADPTGDEYHNLLLSARRAQVVKQELVARGIPGDRLLLQAYGVSEPASTQPDHSSSDRRVVVTWRIL